MKKNLIVNNCPSMLIRKVTYKVYNFIIQIFPEITKKFTIIDFVKPHEIRKIKRKVWNKDHYTDTITLIFEDSVQIYICLEIVKLNSKKNKTKYIDELSFVLLHSFLHSINMDEEQVREIQNEVFKKFKSL